MFAKLKKKIQDEGSPGSISETDGRVAKLPSPGPGIASPVKLDFSGLLSFHSIKHLPTSGFINAQGV